MKKQILFLTVLTAGIFSSCKKNTDEIKDIKPLFSNTTWTGEIKYPTVSVPEPVGIWFDGNGTFTWHERGGNYVGVFTVNNDDKTVSLTFNNGSMFTASITNDNKFANLQYGSNFSLVINRLGLNTTAVNAQQLAGTNWSGTIYYTAVSSQREFKINFKSASLLENYVNGFFSNSPYQINHNTIRFSGAFGIIENGEIIGSLGATDKWQVKKQ